MDTNATNTADNGSAEMRTVYVGNLDQRVTDTMLHDFFATIGPVLNVKIVNIRRHGPHAGVNYGFVEFADSQSAKQALQGMQGRRIFNHDIKLNWATQSSQSKEDTANHFHIFVGDLAPEVNDEMLYKAFSTFETLSDAHVLWDQNTGNSRGFGFVAFRDKTDAEQAIATMNGEWIGSRPIRCNWATQKGQTATPPPQPGQQLPYAIVINQTPAYVTSVYVGNLAPDTSESDITRPFEQLGTVQEVKTQKDRGFAFVKMESHEKAAEAIVQLQNVLINGRQAKLSWGKDRPPAGHQSHNNHHHYNHQNGGGGHYHRNHHYLYTGRAGHHNRMGGSGFAHQGHILSNNHKLAENGNIELAAVAPNSLASLDPHASGTKAAATSATGQRNQEPAQQLLDI